LGDFGATWPQLRPEVIGHQQKANEERSSEIETRHEPQDDTEKGEKAQDGEEGEKPFAGHAKISEIDRSPISVRK
jgi:hypothetical protein